MLERYFIKPETIDGIRGSWIGEPVERYVAWLTEQGYASRSVQRRVPLLMRFGEFVWMRGARRWEDLPDHVQPFFEKWVRERGQNCNSKRARKSVENFAQGPIQQMLRLVVPDFSGKRRSKRVHEPFLDEVPGFFTYLREERGLREASVYHYGHYLRLFESYLRRINLQNLRDLSPPVLSAFVTDSCGALSKSSTTGLCGALRVFLRYLRREGLIARDLSGTVESPQAYRLSDIPRSISWDEVRRMLEAVDRRTPLGKRDYAVLLLLVIYGLRSCEIAALTLDDIDWKRERLYIPERKAGHSTAYPLSPIVGKAILDYLQHGRPQTSNRHVFFRVLLRHTAP